MGQHIDEDTEGKKETDRDKGDSPKLVLREIVRKRIRHGQVKILGTRYIRKIVSSGKSLGDYTVQFWGTRTARDCLNAAF